MAMGRRRITSIRIDEDVLKRAKELGLNVSAVCERALKEAIRRMERPLLERTETNGGTRALVRPPGFEPGTPGVAGRCPRPG